MTEKFGKKYHREYYKKRKTAIFVYLGGVCVVCGTDKDLEIDHINPEEKSFSIGTRMSIKNNKAELDKCQLLCKEHHLNKTAEENSGFTHGTTYAWMKAHCDCSVCLEHKRNWHDLRNAKRRSGPGYGGRF